MNRIEEIVQWVKASVVREVVGGKMRMRFLQAFDHFLYLFHFDTGRSVATKSQNATFVLYLQAHSRTTSLD